MNLGSPSPMSLLELARKVIEATRSESEIIFDAPVSTSHTSGCPILRALVNFLTGSRRFPSRRSAPPDDIPSRPSRRRGSKRLGSSRSTRRASWERAQADSQTSSTDVDTERTLRQPPDQLPGNGVVSSSVDLAFAVVLTCGGVFSCTSLVLAALPSHVLGWLRMRFLIHKRFELVLWGLAVGVSVVVGLLLTTMVA